MARQKRATTVLALALFVIAVCVAAFAHPAPAEASGCATAHLWAPAKAGSQGATTAATDAVAVPSRFGEAPAADGARWLAVRRQSDILARSLLAVPDRPRSPPLA